MRLQDGESYVIEIKRQGGRVQVSARIRKGSAEALLSSATAGTDEQAWAKVAKMADREIVELGLSVE